MERKEIITNKYLYYSIMSIIVSTFVFPEQIRVAMLGKKLGLVNVMFFLILIFMILKYNKYFKIDIMIIATIANIYMFFTGIFYQNSLEDIILSNIVFTMPLYLVSLSLDRATFKKVFYNLVHIINSLIFLITIIAVIDLILSGSLMDKISTFMGSDFQNNYYIYKMQSVTRMYSVIGSPLTNVEFYLIFYIFNELYAKYFNKIINRNVVLIVTLFGIAFSASKTGFVLFLISILVINSQNKSKKRIFINLAFIIIFILTMFKLGIFDNTIERFISGSLTTGRSEAWEIVQHYNLYPIKFFYGYGLNSAFDINNIISYASAAFEYPFRMFSLQNGLLETIVIYLCIGGYPIIKLLRRKHILLLISYLVLFADVNTFNGLALLGDYMLIFSLFVFIILNLSNYIEYENKKLIC